MAAPARDYCSRSVAHLKVEVSADESGPTLSQADSPVIRRLGHGLLVVYLVDEGDNFSYVQNRHLIEAQLSADALHAMARDNLAALVRQRAEVRNYGSIYIVLADGNFEASVLLLADFWSSEYAHLAPNGFVVACPARDILAFADAASAEGIAELRDLLKRTRGKVDHPLSSRLFRRVGSSWEPLDG